MGTRVVQHAVDGERHRLESAGGAPRHVNPRNRQITHVACVDLVERAVVIGFVRPMIGQPIIGATGIDQRRVDRLREHRRPNRQANCQGEHPGDTRRLFEHRFLPH